MNRSRIHQGLSFVLIYVKKPLTSGGGKRRWKVKEIAGWNRKQWLTAIFRVAACLLFLKVLVAIVYQYRSYFPADFESAFLMGRQESFVGLYRAAFYAHILCGPPTVLLFAFVMFSAGRARIRRFHRPAGRLGMGLVIAIIAPSGFVMAFQAFTGGIAGCGFATHAVMTAACAAIAIHHARGRRLTLHRQWATRCFLLLCSPLLLRLISGATILLSLESDWAYRLNAWLSWLLPLAVHETWLVASSSRKLNPSQPPLSIATEDSPS